MYVANLPAPCVITASKHCTGNIMLDTRKDY
jgi:hypothetical protein